MANDQQEETSRFPELRKGDFDLFQLREIPPTPIESSFDHGGTPRTKANSAVSDVSVISAVSATDSERLTEAASPSRSLPKTRARSHSDESRYSIFPANVLGRKSSVSIKTEGTSRARAASVATSKWSTTLDVPVPSETMESRSVRHTRTSRWSSTSTSSSRSPSRSRGYSNAEIDRTISFEVPARAGSISSRPRGISNANSMISARTSISQDCGNHGGLLRNQHPPSAVPQDDLMAQFENFVDTIDEVPTRRITLKKAVAPAKKTVRWVQLRKFFQNPPGKKSNLFDDKSMDSDGAELRPWKSRCSTASALVGSVLVIYVIFMIWASQRPGNGTGIRTIFEGECNKVNASNLGLHILINVLGGFVTTASVCAWYLLSSPTRQEIDEAHAMGRSFDIGVLSLRNLRTFKNRTLFVLLLLSSLPIHLLGNSTVFSSSSEVNYDVVIAGQQFLNQPSVNCSQDVAATCTETDDKSSSCETHPLNSNTVQGTSSLCNTSTFLHESATQNKLQRLNAMECLTAYSTLSSPASSYGNVLVITKGQPLFTNNTIMLAFHHISYSSVLRGHGWTCGPDDPLPGQTNCDIPNLILNADIWTLGPSLLPTTSTSTSLASYERWNIDYCLAETLTFQPMCRLQYSRVLILCIIIACAVKIICILYIAFTVTKPVLSTVKDAVASFQGRIDIVTSNRNFMHRDSAWKSRDGLLILDPEVEGQPRNFRWFHGASLRLWLATLFLSTVLLAIPLVLLTTATVPLPSPYSISLGTYSPLAIIKTFTWSSSSFTPLLKITNSELFPTIFLANIPHIAISILLFLFAEVYTRMLSANTFSNLTNPSPSLKSRKIMGFSCACLYISVQVVLGVVLHILVSQALFVHHVEIVGSNRLEEPMEYLDLGYNPLGILTSLVFGGLILVVLMMTGLWRLSGGQLVGSDSMEIAAACKQV